MSSDGGAPPVVALAPPSYTEAVSGQHLAQPTQQAVSQGAVLQSQQPPPYTAPPPLYSPATVQSYQSLGKSVFIQIFKMYVIFFLFNRKEITVYCIHKMVTEI